MWLKYIVSDDVCLMLRMHNSKKNSFIKEPDAMCTGTAKGFLV